MSYNIDSVEVIDSHGFCITLAKLEAIKPDECDMPEGNVFDMVDEGHHVEKFKGPDGSGVQLICLSGFWWYGEGSGRAEDTLIEVLSHFDGRADLLLTWEGGDCHSGLRLRDGKVTKHEVVFALGDES